MNGFDVNYVLCQHCLSILSSCVPTGLTSIIKYVLLHLKVGATHKCLSIEDPEDRKDFFRENSTFIYHPSNETETTPWLQPTSNSFISSEGLTLHTIHFTLGEIPLTLRAATVFYYPHSLLTSLFRCNIAT